ncbi:MAG: PQQ-binding-like beta-propeller repeat protein [Caldisericia bacterium]
MYTTSNSGTVNRFDISSSTMVWRKNLGAEIVATPCTNESKLIVPTYSEDGKVFCLDNETGGIIWTKKMKGPVSSSPIIIGDKIYIATELAVIACLDLADGSMIWSRVAEEMIVTSPCETDTGIVFSDSNKQVYCLDRENGTVIWSRRFSNQIATAPSYSDKNLYFTFDDGSIACISSSNGEYANWFKRFDESFDTSPAITDALVIAAATDGSIHCIRKKDGIRIWEKNLGIDGISNSPVIVGTKIIINNNDGKLFVLDLANKGNILLEKDFDKTFRSTPSVGYGKIYINSYDGEIYCLSAKAKPGKEPVPEPDPPMEGDEITMHGSNINLVWRRCNYNAVATNDGNVFVEYKQVPNPQNRHANVFLNYLDKKTGKELWQNVVYIGLDLEDTYGYQYYSNRGKLYCAALGDHNSYQTVWKYDIRTQTRDWMSRDQVHGYSTPNCPVHIQEYDGGVYLGNCNGELFCLNSTDGNVRWTTKLDYPFDYPNFLGAYGGDYLYWVSTELNCTDKLTGKPLWRFDSLSHNVSGNPTIWDNKLLVASKGHKIDIINCVNRYNGDLLWSFDSKGYIDSLARYNSTLIFEEYQENSEFVDIVAIDLETKEEKWRIEKGKFNIRKGYRYKQLSGDTFYFTGTKGEKSYVIAVEPETGKTLWMFHVHEPATRMLIDNDKYYNVIGRKVLYPGENCLYCYALSPRSEDWIFDPVPDPDPEPLPPTDPNPPSESPEEEVFEDNDPCGWYMTRGFIKEDYFREESECGIDVSNLSSIET